MASQIISHIISAHPRPTDHRSHHLCSAAGLNWELLPTPKAQIPLSASPGTNKSKPKTLGMAAAHGDVPEHQHNRGDKSREDLVAQAAGFPSPQQLEPVGTAGSAPAPANTAGRVGMEINIGWANIFFGGEIIPKMEFPRAFSNCKGPQAGKIPRSHGYFLQPTCCHLASKTFIYLYISFHLLALFPQCPVEQLCCSIPSRTRSLTHRTALLQLPGYTLHQIWSLEKNLKMKKTPGC